MSRQANRSRMRPFQELTSFERARRVSQQLAAPPSEEEVLALQQANGRVLAHAAVARTDVPSADRAAMDGYAVRSDDTREKAPLRRVGRIAAGQQAEASVDPGTCIETATGAPIPPGADAVIPVEHTLEEEGGIRAQQPVSAGDHISVRGTDLQAGIAVGREGEVLTPALLSACAAAGIAEVSVWRRPRVLLAPTGDEVVPLGRDLLPGQVYDSNASGLQALLEQAGAEVVRADIVVDEAAALRQLFERPGHDLIATIGGTSVGRRDLVPEVVAAVGEVLVHGVAVRPGKPLLLGRVAERTVIGLPGFPTTCMILGYAILEPMVRRMGGLPAVRPTLLCTLEDTVRSPPDKAQLLPVAVTAGLARPTFTFSSAISSMAHATGWLEIAAEVEELAAGEHVQVHLF